MAPTLNKLGGLAIYKTDSLERPSQNTSSKATPIKY